MHVCQQPDYGFSLGVNEKPGVTPLAVLVGPLLHEANKRTIK